MASAYVPCIKGSSEGYYTQAPLQVVYQPNRMGTAHDGYRFVIQDEYDDGDEHEQPLYYAEAPNVSTTVEPTPETFEDWHTDFVYPLRVKIEGEWSDTGNRIVYQHFTGAVIPSGQTLDSITMTVRIGIYHEHSDTFTEWSRSQVGFGGARGYRDIEVGVTAYHIEYEEDGVTDTWVGPVFIGNGYHTYADNEQFKVQGYLMSVNWFKEHQYDDSLLREIIDPNDQDPDGPSGPGGGGGSHDPGGDIIPVPGVDPINAYTCGGLVDYYRVTKANLDLLGSVIYEENFLAFLHNIFNKPMDMVAGLMMLPASPGSTVNMIPCLGSRDLLPDNGSLPLITQRFIEVNLGTLYVDEYYGGALDYSPNTKIDIHLPFIGTRQLDVDEVMGKTISLKYHIDSYNGDCVAFISVLNRATNTYGVRYQFSGSCGQQMPVTSTDFSSVISNAVTLATTAIGAAMTAGTSVPVEAAAGAVATASVNTVVNSKANISKSGNLGGSTGIMSVLRPYIVKTVPRQSLPENYRTFEGYPLNMTAMLSDMEGFTVVDSVHLHGIPCTDAELAEIESLLKEGVIL